MPDDFSGFDLVLAFGVVHHLDDDGASRVLRKEPRRHWPSAVAPSRVDPTLDPRVNRGSRALVISADRGDRVRSADEYARLAKSAFGEVRTTVRTRTPLPNPVHTLRDRGRALMLHSRLRPRASGW